VQQITHRKAAQMNRDCVTCPHSDEGVKCPSPYYQPCADHLASQILERAAIRGRIKVKTENVYPPIPIRDYDWSAVDDNTYDGHGCPIGWGRTEQAAIDDLVEQILEQ